MDRFGFRNKEIIIEEEDPAAIQMTTQMSTNQLASENQASDAKAKDSWKTLKRIQNSLLAKSFQNPKQKLTRNALPSKARSEDMI